MKHLGTFRPKLRKLRKKLLHLHVQNESTEPTAEILKLEELIKKREYQNAKYNRPNKETGKQPNRNLTLPDR